MDCEWGERTLGDRLDSWTFFRGPEGLETAPPGWDSLSHIFADPLCPAGLTASQLKSPLEHRAAPSPRLARCVSPSPFAQECAGLGLVWGEDGLDGSRRGPVTSPDHMQAPFPSPLSAFPSPAQGRGFARCSRMPSPLFSGAHPVPSSSRLRSASPLFSSGSASHRAGGEDRRVVQWLESQVNDPQSVHCLRGGVRRVARTVSLLCVAAAGGQDRDEAKRQRGAEGNVDGDAAEPPQREARERDDAQERRIRESRRERSGDGRDPAVGGDRGRSPGTDPRSNGQRGDRDAGDSERYWQRRGGLEGEGDRSATCHVSASALVSAVQNSRENLNSLTGVLTTLRLSSKDDESDFDLPLFVQSQTAREKHHQKSLELGRMLVGSPESGFPPGLQIPGVYRGLKACASQNPQNAEASKEQAERLEAPNPTHRYLPEGAGRDEESVVETEITEQLLFNANAAVEGTTLYNNLLCESGPPGTWSANSSVLVPAGLSRHGKRGTQPLPPSPLSSPASTSPSAARSTGGVVQAEGKGSEAEAGGNEEPALRPESSDARSAKMAAGDSGETRRENDACPRRVMSSAPADEDGSSGGAGDASHWDGAEGREDSAADAVDCLRAVIDRNITALPGFMTVGRYACDLFPKSSRVLSETRAHGLAGSGRPLSPSPPSSPFSARAEAAPADVLAARLARALEGERLASDFSDATAASDLGDFLEGSCAPQAFQRGRQAAASVRGARRKRVVDQGPSPPPSSPAVRDRSLVRWSQRLPVFATHPLPPSATRSRDKDQPRREESAKDRAMAAEAEHALAGRDVPPSHGLENTGLQRSAEQRDTETGRPGGTQHGNLAQVKKEAAEERPGDTPSGTAGAAQGAEATETGSRRAAGTAKGRAWDEGAAPATMATDERFSPEASDCMQRDAKLPQSRVHVSSSTAVGPCEPVDSAMKAAQTDKDADHHGGSVCAEKEKPSQFSGASFPPGQGAQDEMWRVAGGMYNGWKGTYDVWIYRRVPHAREGKEDEKRKDGEKKAGKGKPTSHGASPSANSSSDPAPSPGACEAPTSASAPGPPPRGVSTSPSSGSKSEESGDTQGEARGCLPSSSSPLDAKRESGLPAAGDRMGKTQAEEASSSPAPPSASDALASSQRSGETREAGAAGDNDEKGEARAGEKDEPAPLPAYEWRVKRFSALIHGHEKASRLASKYCAYLERFGRIRGRLSICNTCGREACPGCTPTKKKAGGLDASPQCRNGRDGAHGAGGAGKAPKRRSLGKKGAAGAAGAVGGDKARKGTSEDDTERDRQDRREENGTPESPHRKRPAERRVEKQEKEGREEDRGEGKNAFLSSGKTSFESSHSLASNMRSSSCTSFETKRALSPSSLADGGKREEGARGRSSLASDGPSRDTAPRSHSSSAWACGSSRRGAKNPGESLRRTAVPTLLGDNGVVPPSRAETQAEASALQQVFEVYSEAGEAWETLASPVCFSPSGCLASWDAVGFLLGARQTTAVARLGSGRMNEAGRKGSLGALNSGASSTPKGKGLGSAGKRDSVTLSFLARVCRKLKLFLLLRSHTGASRGLPGDPKCLLSAQTVDGKPAPEIAGSAGRGEGSEPGAGPNAAGGPLLRPLGSSASGWSPSRQSDARAVSSPTPQGTSPGHGVPSARSPRQASSPLPLEPASPGSPLSPEAFAAGVRPLLETAWPLCVPGAPQLDPETPDPQLASWLSPAVKTEPSGASNAESGTVRGGLSSLGEPRSSAAPAAYPPSAGGQLPSQPRDTPPGSAASGGRCGLPAAFDGPSSSGAGYSVSPGSGFPASGASPHGSPFFPEPYGFHPALGGEFASPRPHGPFAFPGAPGSLPPGASPMGSSRPSPFLDASARGQSGDSRPLGSLRGAAAGAGPGGGRGPPFFESTAEGDRRFAPGTGAMATPDGGVNRRGPGEKGRAPNEDEKKKGKKAKKSGRSAGIEERLSREEAYDVVVEDESEARRQAASATETRREVGQGKDGETNGTSDQPADVLHGYFKARVRNRRIRDGLLLRMTAVLLGKGFYDMETVERGAARRRGAWGDLGEEEESETKCLFSNPVSQKPCDFILYFDTRENRDASVALLNQALPAAPPRLPPRNGESQGRRTLRQLYDHFLEPKCQCLEDKTLKVKRGVINLLGFPRLYVKLHCSISWDERLSLFSSFLHWLCREDDSLPPPWSSPELHPELLTYLAELGRKGFASGGAAATTAVNAPDLPLDDAALLAKNTALLRAYMQQDTGTAGSGSAGVTPSDNDLSRKEEEPEDTEKDSALLPDGLGPEGSGKGDGEREEEDKRGGGDEGSSFCAGSPLRQSASGPPAPGENASRPSTPPTPGGPSSVAAGCGVDRAPADGCADSSPVASEHASLLSSPSATRAEALSVPGVGLVDLSLPDGVKFDKSKLAFRCYWREGHGGLFTVGAGPVLSPSSGGVGAFLPSRPTVCAAQNKSRTFSCRKYGLYQSRVLALQARLLSELLWPQPPSPARIRVSAIAAVVYGLTAAPVPLADPWQAVCGVAVAEDALRQRREIWKKLLDPSQERPDPAPLSQLSLPPVSAPPRGFGQELAKGCDGQGEGFPCGSPWPAEGETALGATGNPRGFASAWATPHGKPGGDTDAAEAQSNYGSDPGSVEGSAGAGMQPRWWPSNVSEAPGAGPCQVGLGAGPPLPAPQGSLGPGGDGRGARMSYDQAPADRSASGAPRPPFAGPFSAGSFPHRGPSFSAPPAHRSPFPPGPGTAGQRLAVDSPFLSLKSEAVPQSGMMAHASSFEKGDGSQENLLAKKRKTEGPSEPPAPDERQVTNASRGKALDARPADVSDGSVPDGGSPPFFPRDTNSVEGGLAPCLGPHTASSEDHLATQNASFGCGISPPTGSSPPVGGGFPQRPGGGPTVPYSTAAGGSYASVPPHMSPFYRPGQKGEADSTFGHAPPSGYDLSAPSPSVSPKLPVSVPSFGNLDGGMNAFALFSPGMHGSQGHGRDAPWGHHLGTSQGEARGSEEGYFGASRGPKTHELEESLGGQGEEGVGRERQRKRRKSVVSLSSQDDNSLFAPTSAQPPSVPFSAGDGLGDASGIQVAHQAGPHFSHGGSPAPSVPDANAMASQQGAAGGLPEAPTVPSELVDGSVRRQSASIHEDLPASRAAAEKADFPAEGAQNASAQQLSAETLTFLLGANVVWEENEKRWRVQVRPPSPRGDCDKESTDGKLGGDKRKRKRDSISSGTNRRSSAGTDPEDHKAGTLEWVSLAQLHQAQKLQNQLVGKMERGKGEAGDEERLGGDGRGNIFFDANGTDENAKKAALLKARRWLRRRIVQGQILVAGLNRDGLFSPPPDGPERSSSSVGTFAGGSSERPVDPAAVPSLSPFCSPAPFGAPPGPHKPSAGFHPQPSAPHPTGDAFRPPTPLPAPQAPLDTRAYLGSPPAYAPSDMARPPYGGRPEGVREEGRAAPEQGRAFFFDDGKVDARGAAGGQFRQGTRVLQPHSAPQARFDFPQPPMVPSGRAYRGVRGVPMGTQGQGGPSGPYYMNGFAGPRGPAFSNQAALLPASSPFPPREFAGGVGAPAGAGGRSGGDSGPHLPGRNALQVQAGFSGLPGPQERPGPGMGLPSGSPQAVFPHDPERGERGPSFPGAPTVSPSGPFAQTPSGVMFMGRGGREEPGDLHASQCGIAPHPLGGPRGLTHASPMPAYGGGTGGAMVPAESDARRAGCGTPGASHPEMFLGHDRRLHPEMSPPSAAPSWGSAGAGTFASPPENRQGLATWSEGQAASNDFFVFQGMNMHAPGPPFHPDLSNQARGAG
ncbi:unnamed protein product [Neospora caninum Liverpool]|uniref:AP2 domain transcription factor AP2X-8 n=1 Tax=Neospora caninum (strain Liverpool) TaxID=572307 RepID=F0VL21_NEOCL|nr:uncharacterized protein NCLIV_051990 [Neospora caninum Liverpool]CBZ54773.1 unnamed protein product [Neospora caninum Liverpool]CEL69490.1 TPA: AP2 domain transcription factor AP2X-8 [Neospora caninum Liverpool]|eukprot:XP_003884801.1 uncharacterized protein NCLIV_051990 [Neospora caninum Liverpool]